MLSQHNTILGIFSSRPKFQRLTALKRACMPVVEKYATVGHPHAEKILNCSPQIKIRMTYDHDAEMLGEDFSIKYSFENVNWCRCRYCPMCMHSKSTKWQAKFYKAFAKWEQTEDLPPFIFLTLTQKNCKLQDLRSTVGKMNKAWEKLNRRTDSPIDGYLRTFEVTAQLDESKKNLLKVDGDLMVHPHFHAILAVPHNYFEDVRGSSSKYHSYKKWQAVWKKSLNCDYDPMIWVNRIKSELRGEVGDKNYSIGKSVSEVFKYCVKPFELTEYGDDSTQLLLGISEQTKGLRSAYVGGLFSNYISQKELDKVEDTLEVEEAISQVGTLIQMDWDDSYSRGHGNWRLTLPEREVLSSTSIMNY